jgi:hypothetical protein
VTQRTTGSHMRKDGGLDGANFNPVSPRIFFGYFPRCVIPITMPITLQPTNPINLFLQL